MTGAANIGGLLCGNNVSAKTWSGVFGGTGLTSSLLLRPRSLLYAARSVSRPPSAGSSRSRRGSGRRGPHVEANRAILHGAGARHGLTEGRLRYCARFVMARPAKTDYSGTQRQASVVRYVCDAGGAAGVAGTTVTTVGGFAACSAHRATATLVTTRVLCGSQRRTTTLRGWLVIGGALRMRL